MGGLALLVATIVVLAVTGFAAAGWLTWFSYDLTTGLPNRDALRGLGDMAQATTLFDAGDRPAFTIFKEQRIEVPLVAGLAEPDQGGRLGRGSAVLRAQRRRRRPRRSAPSFRNLQAGRRAEGGSTITQQLARQSFLTRGQDLPPQAEGSHPRRATSRTSTPRTRSSSCT